MARESSHLVAYCIITASSTNIPANGTWLQVTLKDPTGTNITGNTLPSEVTMISCSGTGFAIGVDASATPTWRYAAHAVSDPIAVNLGGAGKKVGVTSISTAITTGTYSIFFYA